MKELVVEQEYRIRQAETTHNAAIQQVFHSLSGVFVLLKK